MTEILLHLAWCNAHKMAPCWSRSWLDQSLNSGTMFLQSEVALLSIWTVERANQHNAAITVAMRFCVLTMVLINIQVFWDVMLCCWVNSYICFKGMWCLHLQVNYSPWKCLKLLTQWYCKTSQKTYSSYSVAMDNMVFKSVAQTDILSQNVHILHLTSFL